MQEYSITETLRSDVKSPIGRLVKDSEVRKDVLEPYFARPDLKVSVGDRTTERLIEFNLSPNLEIIDTIEKRAQRPALRISKDQQLLVARNKSGTISSDALSKLGKCLEVLLRDSQKRVRLVIDGEEDLLVLPVVAFFPSGTIVFYGQPHEGLVIIDSKDSTERAKEMLLQLGIRSFENP